MEFPAPTTGPARRGHGGGCFVTVTLLGLAGILCACSSNLVNPQIPPPGSPAFEEGYLEGCDSGFASADRPGYSANWRKDEARYGGEPDYRRGWDTGLAACYQEQLRHPRTGDGHGGK